ncbi:unnamed protein product [Ceratitis capitata]|uniref:(Mediterranean fruit fly) hypothetical protein n=1 Tax=Ceratitis capitata TaxID=7213 RepID=A0A811UPU2_CERCA|nr:unnamed protein product [Ceratitis capitata]
MCKRSSNKSMLHAINAKRMRSQTYNAATIADALATLGGNKLRVCTKPDLLFLKTLHRFTVFLIKRMRVGTAFSRPTAMLNSIQVTG